jgi:hypothetical protein
MIMLAAIPSDRFTVTSVSVTRGEGFTSETGTFQAGSLAEADEIIRRMARTAPDDGTCHKGNFSVAYSNGETYEGRLELTRDMAYEDEILASQMRQRLAMVTGNWKPGHMDDERYAQYLREFVRPETRRAAEDFLARYQIG